jgi:hypothetical protein
MEAREQAALKAGLIHLSKLHTQQQRRQKKEAEQEPVYGVFLEMYFEFHSSTVGTGPRMDARQGKALKGIISYLRSNSKRSDDQGAIDAWAFILKYWSSLSDFMQKQITLTSIERNISEIIMQIKQHATRNNRQNTSAQLAARIANRRHGSTD